MYMYVPTVSITRTDTLDMDMISNLRPCQLPPPVFSSHTVVQASKSSTAFPDQSGSGIQ